MALARAQAHTLLVHPIVLPSLSFPLERSCLLLSMLCGEGVQKINEDITKLPTSPLEGDNRKRQRTIHAHDRLARSNLSYHKVADSLAHSQVAQSTHTPGHFFSYNIFASVLKAPTSRAS